METIKFKIILTFRDISKSFDLQNDQIIVGNSERSNFIVQASLNEEKVIIYEKNQEIYINILAPDYSIVSNNKTFNKIKISKSCTLMCGKLKLNIEKIVKPESIPSSSLKNIKKQTPVEVPPTLNVIASNQKDNHIYENTVSSHTNKELFSIVFDDSNDCFSKDSPYLDFRCDSQDYIELNDKTVTPDKLLNVVYSDDMAIHITHTHNGVTILDQFYTKFKNKIFFSNLKKGNNYFVAHDSNIKKSQLTKFEDGTILVIKQPNYDFFVVNQRNSIIPIQQDFYSLNKNERIILSKGLSQIIVQLSEAPPQVKKDNWPEIDEILLKCLSISWLVFFIPLLLILLFVDTPLHVENKPEKEIAIIFKRPDPPKIEKPEIEEVVQPKMEQQQQQAVMKAPEPAKKPETPKTKIASQSPPPKAPPKVEKAPPAPVQQIATASPTVAQKTEVKQAKQTFKFSALATISKTAGSVNGSVQSANNTSNIKLDHLVVGQDSTLTQSNSNLVGTGTTASTIETSNSSDYEGNGLGTSGLSRKAASMTTYRESDIKVLGSIDPELIKKILREYIPQFRHCYQKELVVNPSVSGVFDLNFVINSKGRGMDVFLKPSKGKFNKPTTDCIEKVVSIIQFPQPKGGGTVDVRQPLNFAANN